MSSRDELYPASSGAVDLGPQPEYTGGGYYFKKFPRLSEATEAWLARLEEWDQTGGVFSVEEMDTAYDEITEKISEILSEAEPGVEHYHLAPILTGMAQITANNIRIQVAKIGEEPIDV